MSSASLGGKACSMSLRPASSIGGGGEQSLSSLYFKRKHCVHDRGPTVHMEDLPGNEARFIHAQEHHGVADIGRGAQTAHRGPASLVPGPNRVLDRLG